MQADVVICGAGIAGISTAYFLSVEYGVKNIFLLDDRPPLSLTSDKSTECYRNWWPDPAMVSLMNHSLDLLEELAVKTQNVLNLNRRGYLYVTCDPRNIQRLLGQSRSISDNGGGEIRHFSTGSLHASYHPSPPEGFQHQPVGADLITSKDLIKTCFPYLTSQSAAVLHVRRAGWLSAQQLGSFMLEKARQNGVTLLPYHVVDVVVDGNQVSAVKISDGQTIQTSIFINAAGPMLNQVAGMVGLHLPVYHELHQKFSLRDPLGVIPRDAPLVINMDPIQLSWTDEERSLLLDEGLDNEYLFQEMPSGAHLRPEGALDSQSVLMLWDYQTKVSEPHFPPQFDEMHPDITLRGLSRLIPGLTHYIDRRGRPVVDGGYYTRTAENRPLIGPVSVDGFYLLGALSGYGIMAACAAGDLLARHICNTDLPGYASSFLLTRYEDPAYLDAVTSWGDQGQL